MIRLATPADVPAVVALERGAFGADAWDADAVVAELEGPGRRFVVAEGPDGDLSGYAVSMTLGDVSDLQRIVVHPARRRTGLASALLEDLLAHTGGADRMLLEVSAANAGAVAFYAAHGFERVDVRRRYYRDGSDALVLHRSLVEGRGRSGTMAP